MPFKQIATALGISPGSAFLWTRDIELTPEQVTRNLRRAYDPERARRAAASWSERNRRARAMAQETGRAAASDRNPLHLAGCMRYWAEGTKGRNAVKFSNSDPRMVLLFRRFLTDALEIARERICLSINVHTGNGLTIEDIERFWLDLLGLPRSSVRGHTLNHVPTSSSGRAKNKLPYGVCTLRVHSTSMLQHIYGAIQEYAEFEEPAWLG